MVDDLLASDSFGHPSSLPPLAISQVAHCVASRMACLKTDSRVLLLVLVDGAAAAGFCCLLAAARSLCVRRMCSNYFAHTSSPHQLQVSTAP